MNSIKSLILATAMALPAAAAVAQSTNHVITIERWGYYPGMVYVQPGDTITFVNGKPWVAAVRSHKYRPTPCGASLALTNIYPGQSKTVSVSSCLGSEIHEPNFGSYFNETPAHTFYKIGTAPTGD